MQYRKGLCVFWYFSPFWGFSSRQFHWWPFTKFTLHPVFDSNPVWVYVLTRNDSRMHLSVVLTPERYIQSGNGNYTGGSLIKVLVSVWCLQGYFLFSDLVSEQNTNTDTASVLREDSSCNNGWVFSLHKGLYPSVVTHCCRYWTDPLGERFCIFSRSSSGSGFFRIRLFISFTGSFGFCDDFHLNRILLLWFL